MRWNPAHEESPSASAKSPGQISQPNGDHRFRRTFLRASHLCRVPGRSTTRKMPHMFNCMTRRPSLWSFRCQGTATVINAGTSGKPRHPSGVCPSLVGNCSMAAFRSIHIATHSHMLYHADSMLKNFSRTCIGPARRMMPDICRKSHKLSYTPHFFALMLRMWPCYTDMTTVYIAFRTPSSIP